MDRREVFCPECRSDVTCTIEEKLIKETLKGDPYEYTGKMAVCRNCGSELYIAEVEDYNLKAFYDAYRRKHSIISLEKIVEIPEKYGIGKRPLSLLLGWGEMTFSRYYDGDMPTKQYSDILERIYNDATYYLSLLEKNKDNLKSQRAYKKSRQKTEALIKAKKKPRTKIDTAINYLLYQCEDITPLALQKILYYIQGFHYALKETFIFREDCEAWAHGPVYRDIYFRYKSYQFDPIEGRKQCDESTFSTYEKAIIDSIIKSLCCYSGKTLEKFTHSESPWLNTRADLPADAPSNRIIPKKEIGVYFKSVKRRYNIINPSDIELYAKDKFERI